MKCISNGLVGSFNRAVLMGAVGTGGPNGVAKTLKESANFLIIIKFASLVHADILARDLGSVLLEPIG
jgi:hypothetical protein